MPGYELIDKKERSAINEIFSKKDLFYNGKRVKKFENKLYVPSINNRISSFAFPLICKDSADRAALMSEMEAHGIEFRPIVSGNLLRQPFLKDYAKSSKMPNADILHANGFYISNNHFVGKSELNLLENALSKALAH